jgi:phage tail sheath protein FI
LFDDPSVTADGLKRGGSGLREVFLNVSMDRASPRFVTQVLLRQSNLARIAALGAARPAETAHPTNFTATSGDDGTALVDADILGEEDPKTGIYALKKTDIFNLLCLPPLAPGADGPDIAMGTWTNASKFCTDHRAFLIIDPPHDWTVATAVTSVGTFSEVDRNHSAVYFPRLLISDPLQENKLAVFAPCGAVAGIYARTDTARGVWKAPAGIETTLAGVSGLAIQGNPANLTDGEVGQLNQVGINSLRGLPVIGQVVWGARTLEGADILASQWKYLPVRRTALFIEESLYRGTQWVVFEPNDEPLWAQIRLNVGAFMQNLFRQGAFQGKTPQEAYFVKCDKETTTQNDINLGIVNIVVGFAPLKPAEFVVLQIQQMAGQIVT